MLLAVTSTVAAGLGSIELWFGKLQVDDSVHMAFRIQDVLCRADRQTVAVRALDALAEMVFVFSAHRLPKISAGAWSGVASAAGGRRAAVIVGARALTVAVTIQIAALPVARILTVRR